MGTTCEHELLRERKAFSVYNLSKVEGFLASVTVLSQMFPVCL